MPHPGAHIAVVQILASSKDPANAALATLLGNAQTNLANGGANADAVLRNRYACMGAVGPDLLYFLLDASDTMVDTQDFVIRLYSTFQAVQDIGAEMAKLADAAVKAVPDEANLLDCAGMLGAGLKTVIAVLDTAKGVVVTLANLTAGMYVKKHGLNLFSLLSSPRQDNVPPKEWYWADHLHYNRTGQFTRNLLNLAMLDPKYRDEPALAAYAGGYFTHYVADTIGHPYVNAIVGGPYRLHRQRHTLVENFIDNIVWRNGFVSGRAGPDAFNPLTGRAWVDEVRTPETPKNARPSSFYRSMVHQMIDIGGSADSLADEVSDFLAGVASDLAQENAKYSTATINFTSDVLFDKWCDLLVDALRQTYQGVEHPVMVNKDNDGFLKRDDIKTAYVTCYALMKMATTESMTQPVEPDFSKVTDALKEAWDKLKKGAAEAFDDIFSLPSFPGGGGFSWSAAWDSLSQWAERVMKGVVKLIETAVDVLAELCEAGGHIAREATQLVIYVVQAALLKAYHAARVILELRAYAQPTDETASALPQLWQPGRDPDAAGSGTGGRNYPVMEREEASEWKPFTLMFTRYSQDQLMCGIEPVQHPLANQPAGIELPSVTQVTVHTPTTANPLFELFWAPRGTSEGSNMFAASSPMIATGGADTGQPQGFRQPPGLDFGGIVPNCRDGLRAILSNIASGATSVEANGFNLPDYNLDGDRGGGFRSWQLVGGSHRVGSGNATVSVAAWGEPQ